jgi:hypothetical protein
MLLTRTASHSARKIPTRSGAQVEAALPDLLITPPRFFGIRLSIPDLSATFLALLAACSPAFVCGEGAEDSAGTAQSEMVPLIEPAREQTEGGEAPADRSMAIPFPVADGKLAGGRVEASIFRFTRVTIIRNTFSLEAAASSSSREAAVFEEICIFPPFMELFFFMASSHRVTRGEPGRLS